MSFSPSQRLPLTLAVLVFVPVACFERDCGPDAIECETDQNCPAGSVCRQTTDGCGDGGPACVEVTECASDADCPAGQPCISREPDPAEHPFERTVAPGGVCGCEGEGGCQPFLSTSASTTTSGGGGDATGGGFDPGTSITVGPGGSQSSASSGAGGNGGDAASSSGSAASSGSGGEGGASGAGGAQASTSTGSGGAGGAG